MLSQNGDARAEYAGVTAINKRVAVRLGTFIRKERLNKGMNQVPVAKALKRSQPWLARVEAGRHRLSVVEFLAISKVINFDPVKVIRVLREQI